MVPGTVIILFFCDRGRFFLSQIGLVFCDRKNRPLSQISLGVATYGYDWPVGQTGGFSKPTSEIMKQVAMKGYDVKWDEKHQEPYYTYTDSNGIKREVWFENERTLQTKIGLVDKYKLSGISIWRLGYEDQKFWDILVKNWGKK